MIGQNFLSGHSLDVVAPLSAAGTSEVASDSVDMSGWDGVVFFGTVDTANAGNKVHVAQGADDSADWEHLEGSEIVPGSNAEPWVIEVHQPIDRFLRAEVTRGVSTALGPIWAIRYRGRVSPAVHAAEFDDNVVMLASPAEGTP